MLIIKNAKIFTMDDKAKSNQILEKGDILVDKNGKIIAIDVSIDPKNIDSNSIDSNSIDSNSIDSNSIDKNNEELLIIEAQGLVVIPGMIDAHTHYGLMNYESGENNVNELASPINPSLDISYGIDASLPEFKTAISTGITSVGILPGSANIIGGTAIAVKTYGDNIFKMTIKNPIALKAAFGKNPIGLCSSRGMSPMTNMALYKIFDDYLSNAKAYIERGKVPFDRNFEVFEKVFNKEIPIRIHCGGIEILHIIEICKKYNVDFVLEHAVGALPYIEEIASSECSLVFGPICSMNIKQCFEDCKTLIELDKRGKTVAIMTDGPMFGHRLLIHEVGELVRQGMDHVRALKTVTINAAKILGLEKRIGSIEVGKDADFAIFKGTPCLDVGAELAYTIIDGKVVYKNDYL